MGALLHAYDAVRHKQVFELRYQFGHVFYDRLGRVAAELLRKHEGWSFAQLSSDHATLARKEQNLSFNYGVSTLALSQVQTADVHELTDAEQFGLMADEFAGLVVDTLGLSAFTRVGYRVWHLFETANRQEAVEVLSRSAFAEGAHRAALAFGNVYDLQLRTEVDREEHIMRIQVAPAHQSVDIDPATMAKIRRSVHGLPSRQRRQALIDRERARRKVEAFPVNSLLIDLDASVDDPEYPAAFRPVDFIAAASEDMGAVMAEILKEAPGENGGIRDE